MNVSVPSIASLFAPKSIHELPWLPEQKQKLHDFIFEITCNYKQCMFLIIGPKGSGKSLVLHHFITALLYEHQKDQISDTTTLFEDWKRKHVLTITPFRCDQATLSDSVNNFVQLNNLSSTVKSKQLLLVDDLDYCTGNEKAIIHELLLNVHLHHRFCIIATCRSIDQLGERTTRFARTLHLPTPELNEANHRFFATMYQEVYKQADLSEEHCLSQVECLWKENGLEDYHSFYQLIDLQLLLNESTAEKIGFQEKQELQKVIDCFAVKDKENALISLENFAKRGYSINDFLSLLWKILQLHSEYDEIVLQIAQFTAASNYRSSSSFREYQELAVFICQ